ncbi:MAG: transglutaminase domain-containing protein [Oscillospiraceae bacterium]|nr:transglutaminase domain-containing protein [Oscillospiraceae bacterium]
MKRDQWIQAAWGALIAFCMVFGSLGGLATGMELLTTGQLVSLGLWCAALAAGLCALQLLRYAPWAWLALGLGLAFAWFFGPLKASCHGFLAQMSVIYNKGYGWKILSWADGQSASLLPFFRSVAPVLMLPICACVGRRGAVSWALPLAFLPIGASLLLTDTVPQVGYVFIYLFAVLLLLLTQGVRRRQASQGNALSLFAAPALLLALGLIFGLNPQKTYNKQHLAQKLDDLVASWVGRLEGSEDAPSQLPSVIGGSAEVDLREVGPLEQGRGHVMTVNASHGGRLYLRGASYADYTGLTWLAGDQRDYFDHWPTFRENAKLHTLTVTTKQAHDMMYLPYYTPKLSHLTKGYLDSSGIKTYSLHYYILSADNVKNTAVDQVSAGFTYLPDTVSSWAGAQALAVIGREVDPQDPQEVAYAVQAIAQYVSSSARYDLDTPQMPQEEEDFARWFLESSDTGYCTHFATAAAVLLRGAGIPARYVSGYCVTAHAYEDVSVTAADAHAWVEVYYPGIGWTVLDPTPGYESAFDPQQTSPAETTPPETTPAETTPGDTTPGTTDPGATTAPDATDPGATGPEATQPGAADPQAAPKKRALGWLKWLAWPLLAVALVLGQWQLRLALSRRALKRQRGNRRALAYWRRLEKLCQKLGQTPPENLLELAQKAKFSNHTLSREEFIQLRSFCASREVKLRQKPWYKQLLYRLVWALY